MQRKAEPPRPEAVKDCMNIQCNALEYAQNLEAAGVPTEQAWVHAQTLNRLRCDVYRLEGQLAFARKIAQTSFIGVGGLTLLLIFAL
jgi:hypothetical protein